MGIMLLITLTTSPFVSTVESSIYSQIVRVLEMNQQLRTAGKFIWTSTLTALPVMEGARSGPKMVEVIDPIGAMDPGSN